MVEESKKEESTSEPTVASDSTAQATIATTEEKKESDTHISEADETKSTPGSKKRKKVGLASKVRKEMRGKKPEKSDGTGTEVSSERSMETKGLTDALEELDDNDADVVGEIGDAELLFDTDEPKSSEVAEKSDRDQVIEEEK